MTPKSSLLIKAIVKGIYVDRDDPACPSRYLHLRVYDTVEAMRDAGISYDLRLGYKDAAKSLAEADGMFQPVEFREFYHKDGTREDRTGSFIGVMRLTKQYLTGETITHESIHAALQAWRMHQWAVKGNMDAFLDTGCGPIEERFAYLAGAIAGEVADLTFGLAMEGRTAQRELTTV